MARAADDPTVVLEQWPVLAPYDFVSRLPHKNCLFHVWRHIFTISVVPMETQNLRYLLYFPRAFWVRWLMISTNSLNTGAV